MRDPGRGKVTIRRFKTEDHQEACQVYYDGILENWVPAVRRYLTFRSPTSALIQLVQISVLYQYFSSLPVFLAVEFIIQSVIMFAIFDHYGGFAR